MAGYTWSVCKGTPTATGFNQQSAGYIKPDDPSYDAGYCDQDSGPTSHRSQRDTRHPRAGAAVVRRSPAIGGCLATLPRDRAAGSTSPPARTGRFYGARRPAAVKVSDDFYASERTLSQWFNAPPSRSRRLGRSATPAQRCGWPEFLEHRPGDVQADHGGHAPPGACASRRSTC
jgi:hypothetical protein